MSERPTKSNLWISALAVLRVVARRILRWTRRLLWTIAGLVTALILLVATIQLTPQGRAWLLNFSLKQANATLPGTLHAKRLDQITPFGIELWGIAVDDPKGTTVLTLEHLRVETDLFRLLSGSVGVLDVQLEEGWVDLRVLEEDRGLLAAFVDPNAPEEPPSDGPPIDVFISHAAAHQIVARLPGQEPLGQLDIHLRELVGSFTLLQGQPEVIVDELSVHATRANEVLIELDGSALVPRGLAPARAAFSAKSGSVELKLEAAGVLPSEKGWDAEPLRLDLSLRGATAARLAQVLREPTLEDAFLGEVSLFLKARGKAQDLEVKGALETAGGRLVIDRMGARGKEIWVELSTEGIALSKVRADLPPREVALHLSAKTTGLYPSPMAVSVEIDQARLDGSRLMDLEASALLHNDALSDLSLVARDGDSHVEILGDATLKGQVSALARLDLRPEFVARIAGLFGQNARARITAHTQVERFETGRLALSGKAGLQDVHLRPSDPQTATETLSLERFEAQFQLAGTPTDLAGKLQIEVSNARAGGWHLEETELSIEGDTSTATLVLDTRGGPDSSAQGTAHVRTIELHLSSDVERNANTTRLRATGSGRLEDQSIELLIEPTEISDRGSVRTQGIVLSLGGQGIRIEGEVSPSGKSDGLDLTIGPLDLAQMMSAIGSSKPLVGTVEGRAQLSGSLALPRATLELSGRGLGLRDHPLAALSVDGSFDAGAGTAALSLDVSSARGLGARAKAEAAFRGGVGFEGRLDTAETQVNVLIDKLGTEFISAYLPPGTLPLEGSLGADMRVTGLLGKPALSSDVSLSIKVPGDAPLEVSHRLALNEGQVDTQLKLQDGHGPWLHATARAMLSPKSPTTPELLSLLPDAGSKAEWEFQVDTKRRSLATLPLLWLVTDTKNLPPFVLQLGVAARHLPLGEPTVSLQLDLEQAGSWDGTNCGGKDVRVSLVASHEGDQNEIKLSVSDSKTELALLSANAQLALAPLLEGRKAELEAANATLRTKKLALETLPFVCDHATGLVSLRLDAEDALGAAPRLKASGTARQLSLGSRDALNLNLSATADEKSLTATLLAAGIGAHRAALGRLSTHVPWSFSHGRLMLMEDTPLEADVSIDHLPVSPLIPSNGPISYPSGTFSAKIRARGSIKKPDLSGDIYLEDLAFTTTGIAQPLRDVSGHLSFHNRQLQVRDLEAHDRDGFVKVDGSVDLSNTKEIDGKLHLLVKDFPIRQQGQVVAFTNFKALAESKVTPSKTDARLTLHEVDTWLESVSIRSGIDLAAHKEFIVNGSDDATPPSDSGAPGKEDETQGATPALVHIVIDAQDRFWVKREDFAVKLSTVLDTKIQDEEVRVTGEVKIDRGYLQLFGKVFELTRESRLRFIGSNPPNPVLELEATHKSRGGSIVSVRITGRGDEPTLQFLIDGKEVDAGVAVQELFGGEKSSSDSDASDQARNFVSGLTAGVLATAARKELGAAAPIIMIDPAEKAGEGRVRAGFELDDIVPPFLRPVVTGAYLEGILARESEDASSGATTQFGALLELYFPRNLFTAGQYGPGTTWSVDFGWQL